MGWLPMWNSSREYQKERQMPPIHELSQVQGDVWSLLPTNDDWAEGMPLKEGTWWNPPHHHRPLGHEQQGAHPLELLGKVGVMKNDLSIVLRGLGFDLISL